MPIARGVPAPEPFRGSAGKPIDINGGSAVERQASEGENRSPTPRQAPKTKTRQENEYAHYGFSS